jgi:hypothetical protein
MSTPVVGRTIAWIAFAPLVATMVSDRLKWRFAPVADDGISVGALAWRIGLTLVTLGAGYVWLAQS